MKISQPNRDAVANLVLFCNERLITDKSYDPKKQQAIDWFKTQFSFLNDSKLEEQLAEAFYQARFLYTLMDSMNLKESKNKGFLKFQIIQYASICEALVNFAIKRCCLIDFEKEYASTTYKNQCAFPKGTKISFNEDELFLCSEKLEKPSIELTTNPIKSEFAASRGIISEATKEKYKELYDLRNNAHLLKAAKSGYHPKPLEAEEAYKLTWTVIMEVKAFVTDKVQP